MNSQPTGRMARIGTGIPVADIPRVRVRSIETSVPIRATRPVSRQSDDDELRRMLNPTYRRWKV